MDANRFDTISKLFASRKTRRTAVAGGLGLVAASVASVGGRTLAQDATPQVATPAGNADDPHPHAKDAKPDPEFLFVQPFDGGTWAAKEGDDGTYTLTLSGAAAHTVYFSDRPERIVGLSPTQKFLDGLGFTPANPPNAAVVTEDEAGEQGILVVELLNPAYDADAATLTYDAKVLADYAEPSLAHLAKQQKGYDLPESFGEGGVFIDDCSDAEGYCYQLVNGNVQQVGDISDIGECYDWTKATCEPCNSDGTSSYYGQLCANAFPDSCTFNDGSWDCFGYITGVS